MNVHSAERNEQFLSWKAAGAISFFVTMFSNVVSCSRRKNEYLWSKGLIRYIKVNNCITTSPCQMRGGVAFLREIE